MKVRTDKPQLAISITKHTVTTPNGKIIHRKVLVNPLTLNGNTATEETDLGDQMADLQNHH